MKITTRNNYQSFRAVNKEVLTKAKQEYSIMNTVSGDLIEELQYSIITKRIPYQDGLDTIEAIRPFTKKKYHNLFIPIIDFCKKKIHLQ